MKRILLCLLACTSSFGATNVWLRNGGPGFAICGATNGNPAVITTCAIEIDTSTAMRLKNLTPAAHGLTAGKNVLIAGVAGNWVVNGIRKVKEVLSSTTFSITDLNGADVDATGSGVFFGDSVAWTFGGEVAQFALKDGPLGFFDGWDGYRTRHIATTSANGLTSLTVTGDVATVTLDYDSDAQTGDYVCVWATGSTGLNCTGAANSARQITVSDARHFTFPAAGVADGTYTSGARVSFWGHGRNPYFVEAWSRSATYTYPLADWEHLGELALTCFVSAESGRCTELYKHVTHAEDMYGGNFACSPGASLPPWGTAPLADAPAPLPWQAGSKCGYSQPNFLQFDKAHLAIAYAVTNAMGLLTTEEKQTFADKIYADVEPYFGSSATACTPQYHLPFWVQQGTAQGGTSNTITLSGDASSNNDEYKNLAIYLISGDGVGTSLYSSYDSARKITAYDGTTKVATVDAPWTKGTPGTNTVYRIAATITCNGTDCTGNKTRWLTDPDASQRLHDGDLIWPNNGDRWFRTQGMVSSYRVVGEPSSDTQITISRSWSVTNNMFFQGQKWSPGKCGMDYFDAFYDTEIGRSDGLHPGGSRRANVADNHDMWYTGGHIGLDMSLAEVDPRALWAFEVRAAHYHDHYLPFRLTTGSGINDGGSRYGGGVIEWMGGVLALAYGGAFLNNAPDWGIRTGAFHNQAYWFMLGQADSSTSRTVVPMAYGKESLPDNVPGFSVGVTHDLMLMNGSPYLPYLRDFTLKEIQASSHSTSLAFLLGTGAKQNATDYTTMPKQWLLKNAALTTCQNLGLGDTKCNPNRNFAAAVSRTGWGATDDILGFFALDYIGDRALLAAYGGYKIAKNNTFLISSEQNEEAHQSWQTQVELGQFGYPGDESSLKDSEILRWAGTNPSGPANNEYAYVVAEVKGATHYDAMGRAYTPSRDQRHIADLKKPGGEHIAVVYDDVATTPNLVKGFVHYTQNGGTDLGVNNESLGRTEGVTTCPGTDNCDTLNTTRTILSQSATDTIISKFLSPQANFRVFVERGTQNGTANQIGGTPAYYYPWACASAWQCSESTPELRTRTIYAIGDIVQPSWSKSTGYAYQVTSYANGCSSNCQRGTTEPTWPVGSGQTVTDNQLVWTAVAAGGNRGGGTPGTTFRVSYCTSDSTERCSLNATAMEAVTVHKIVTGKSDTSLTATALNPDANWTGVQTADKVVMFARGGVMQRTLAFTTSHQGVAQYLIAGLEGERSYQVIWNGTALYTGQRVNRDDNTLYFEAMAGEILIVDNTLAIRDSVLPDGEAGSPYAHTLVATGGTPPYQWRISSGSLPAGLSLTDHTIAGTPLAAGNAMFDLEVSDSSTPPDGDTKTFSIQVQRAQDHLSLGVPAIAPTRAIARFGRKGLEAGLSCQIVLSDQADFTSILESITDSGPAARRDVALGGTATLAPGAEYYVRAVCDGETVTQSFTMAAAQSPVPASLTFLLRPAPRLGAQGVVVEYGPTPAMGGSVEAICGASCRVDVPSTTGALVYVRYNFRDSNGNQLARSRIQPVLVP